MSVNPEIIDAVTVAMSGVIVLTSTIVIDRYRTKKSNGDRKSENAGREKGLCDAHINLLSTITEMKTDIRWLVSEIKTNGGKNKFH